MNPSLALLSGFFFILILFVIDVKKRTNVSSALNIPLLWMMVVGSRPIAQWLYPGSEMASEDVYLSGNPIDRNILTVLLFCGIIVLIRRKINWSKLIRNNGFIFAFFLYGGISIVWSDFSDVALKRWIRAIGGLSMIIIVLTEADPAEAVKVLIKRGAYVLIPLSIVLIKYYRDLGVGYSPWGEGPYMVGVTTDKNALGRLCLICGLVFFWDLMTMWRQRKGKYADKKDVLISALFLSMILWLMISAKSATSLGSLILGIVVLMALNMSIIKRRIKYIGVITSTGLVILLFLQLAFNVNDYFIQLLGRDTTLTGRTELWEDIIGMVSSPLIGTGFSSFWLGDRLSTLWNKYWWTPDEAHNGYIEVYLELGLIGLFLLVGVIYRTFNNIRKTLLENYDYGSFKMALFCLALIYNVTESAFRTSSLIWFMFLVIGIYYNQETQSQCKVMVQIE